MTDAESIKMLKDLTPEQLKEMQRTGEVPVSSRPEIAPQTLSEIAELLRDESGQKWIRCDG
jgi:hypothetical protein